eukprot:g21206.t1
MPWQKWRNQGKGQQWSDWEKPSKKGKDKEEKGGKQPILYGWDGKKIEVKRDGGAKPGSSSGSSHSEAALREENRKIKEVVRNLLGSETQSEADIQALRDFAKVDPREDLKERQRLLNSERRSLNKTAKIREVIDEQEANFQSWQETYKAGLEQEEKRYQAKMAELREELKAAEKGEMEDPVPGSMDDGQESAQDLPVYVQQELADLRGQMRQFMSYAQMMEKKNAALTDQVTMLVTTLQSREQQISSDFSPQHPVRRSGNGNALWVPSKEEDATSVEKRERWVFCRLPDCKSSQSARYPRGDDEQRPAGLDAPLYGGNQREAQGGRRPQGGVHCLPNAADQWRDQAQPLACHLQETTQGAASILPPLLVGAAEVHQVCSDPGGRPID